MSVSKVRDASVVFKHLNGLINIFKPAGMKVKHVKSAILHNICKDLNDLECDEKRDKKFPRLLETGTTADTILRQIHNFNLTKDVLSIDVHYEMEDMRCAPVASLGQHTSGVLLFALNNALRQSMRMQRNPSVRVYHVTGRLGIGTENHLPNTHVTVKANYRHIHADRLSALATSLQASHQRKMFEMCGVNIQSQAAYEMACKGLIRPSDNSQPVIYGIKLIDFQQPYFTLEIHSINESEAFLSTLISEIGIDLKSVAHCSALRCVRHGKFCVESSLLRHGWSLSEIVKNMRDNKDVLAQYPYLLKQHNVELRK